MKNRLVSIAFLVCIALTSIVFFVIALAIRLITGPFDSRLRALHLFTCFWAYFYVMIMPAWPVTIRGREKIDKKATYVVVSNHQSQLDILAAFGLFFHFKWVSKAEVFKLPLIGWNMSLNRYIKLVRGDKASIRKMLQACEETLESGSSVFLFPEGTRSFDGNLRPFKPGAFMLAHKMKLPILPIAISGTIKALPKYSVNFHGKHPITMTVLDPVAYEDFADLGLEETGEMVRQKIIPLVAEHRQEEGEPAGREEAASQEP